jgi:hypothetical protein
MLNHKQKRAHTRVQMNIAQKIEKYGWTLISVFNPDTGCSFVYTVGLEHRYEHPELIVLDLPVQTAADILQHLVEMVAAGRQFRVGDTPVDLPIDPRLSFFEVESRHFAEYLNVARWFYGNGDFRALQVAPAEPMEGVYLLMNE